MRYRVTARHLNLGPGRQFYRGDLVELGDPGRAADLLARRMIKLADHDNGNGTDSAAAARPSVVDRLPGHGAGHTAWAAAAGAFGLAAAAAEAMTTCDLVEFVEARAVDSDRPAESAPWSSWSKYARARGLHADQVANMTRAELITATADYSRVR